MRRPEVNQAPAQHSTVLANVRFSWFGCRAAASRSFITRRISELDSR
ncbi:MAG TPA: hypothetical protein VKS82_21710 [Streptosporangiaceae bacterium]|nr:hypothetical protein [Streptosporangiaceae bacterium]